MVQIPELQHRSDYAHLHATGMKIKQLACSLARWSCMHDISTIQRSCCGCLLLVVPIAGMAWMLIDSLCKLVSLALYVFLHICIPRQVPSLAHGMIHLLPWNSLLLVRGHTYTGGSASCTVDCVHLFICGDAMGQGRYIMH